MDCHQEKIYPTLNKCLETLAMQFLMLVTTPCSIKMAATFHLKDIGVLVEREKWLPFLQTRCLVLLESSHKCLHMLMIFGESEPWGCDLFLLIICCCWLSASRFFLSLAAVAAVVVWSWGAPLFCGLLATKYRRECQEECHHWKG